MKKGFTLMEVLAVLLVIAVITSMAAPAYRAMRFDMKESKAKDAAQKLAEVVRGYYQISHGLELEVCFTPNTTEGKQILNSTDCDNPSATGIPRKNVGRQVVGPTGGETANAINHVNAKRLFACGFLSAKDFVSLPYTFCTFRPSGVLPSDTISPLERFYAVAYAASEDAGKKYFKGNNLSGPLKGYIYVDGSKTPQDTY